MTFEPGARPTLEALLEAGFTRVEPDGKGKRPRKPEEDSNE